MKNKLLDPFEYLYLTTLSFVLYAIYYDLTFLHYKPDAIWICAKTFFIIFPFICSFTKFFSDKNRPVVIALNWILYCTFHVYFMSLSYYATFIQMGVIFSVMVIFNRLQYIILSALCLIASCWAILHAKHEMFYVAQGMTSKPEVLINNICFQLICYIIYYYVTLPRIKLFESDKKFAEYGKTSSFLMHEIAKPLNRMNQNPENFKEELVRLNEVYQIANTIRSKSQKTYKIETLDMDLLLAETLLKYESYIEMYKIKIIKNINVHEIKSDKKLMHYAFDNFIRNAIEANIEYAGERVIEIAISENLVKIKNPFYDSSFTKNNLFQPMSSTKEGHMGVGLYIAKMISDNLNHNLHIDTNDNFFTVKLSV